MIKIKYKIDITVIRNNAEKNFQIGTFLFFDGVKSGSISQRLLYNDCTS